MKSDQATGLLLDGLTIQSEGIAENMYYAIDVIGDATQNDLSNFYNGESEHGDASVKGQGFNKYHY